MLNTISWSEYLAAVAVLLGLYYTGVAILYYRKEILRSVNTPKSKTILNGPAADGNEDKQVPDFEALEEFIEDIDDCLEAAGKEVSKEALLRALRPMLINYTGLREPAYKVAVFNHIIQATEEICGQRIGAEELEMVVEG